MSNKLRLRIARTDRLGSDQQVMEFDATAIPITRIGGRGKRVLEPGQRFAEVIPPAIALIDWDKVPDKAVAPKTKDDGPTTFWLCTTCTLMVERAECEPLPEGECKHQWIPLDV